MKSFERDFSSKDVWYLNVRFNIHTYILVILIWLMDSSSGINISSYNSLNETVQMFFSLNDPSNSLKMYEILSSTFMPFAMYNMILVLLFSELLWIYSMKILNQSIICILFNVSPFFPPKYLILSSVLFLLISYFFSLILRRIQIFMSFV